MQMKILKKAIRKFRDTKYRNKVLLAMFLVSWLPAFIGAVVFQQSATALVRKNITLSREAQLRLVSQELLDKGRIYEHMADYMISNESFLDALFSDSEDLYEVSRGFEEKVDSLMETNMYYYPLIQNMTVYLQDRELEHGSNVAPMEKLTEQKWYQEKVDPEEKGSTWVFSIENDNLYFVRPIFLYSRKKGVLVTSFGISDYLSCMDTAVAEPGEKIYLVDRSSSRIIYTNDTEHQGESYRENINGRSGMWVRYLDNQEVERYNRDIYYWIPWDVLGNSMNRAAGQAQAINALLLLYILVTSILLSSGLVERIVRLTGIVSRIGEGRDTSVENELAKYSGGRDEIGILIESVEEMLVRLKKLETEIYNEKIAHKDLEMRALQAQINPHFLYNSLSIINWKALDAEALEVSEITLMLAEFYRTTLNKGSGIITVDGEIRNIRSYLNIQLVMHDNDFQVKWDIDEKALEWKMPKLVLQPIVENALEHGLDLKEDGDKIMDVRVSIEDGELVLVVRDNGVGMSQEKADSLIYYNSRGYGIKNVHERIKLLYGENHIFRITSREGIGTEVYIRIPGERGTQ